MKKPLEGSWRGGKCHTSLLCALTQKRLLLENVLIDERKQRRPRPVVVIVVGDGCPIGFALQGGEKPVKPTESPQLPPVVLHTCSEIL